MKARDKQLLVDLPLEIEPIQKVEEIKSEEERDKRKRLKRGCAESAKRFCCYK